MPKGGEFALGENSLCLTCETKTSYLAGFANFEPIFVPFSPIFANFRPIFAGRLNVLFECFRTI